jgi:hypothetical protein
MVRAKPVPAEQVERVILVVRGQRVILDADLAVLYEVKVKVLNQAVKRNAARFPADFMFQLTPEEARRSRSQFVTLNVEVVESTLVLPASRRGMNPKYPPHAFTEQGVAMLSSVLRSSRAVQVNIEIMRAFVRLRQMLGANEELARKLAALEEKYDAQFRVVFDAIRELMAPPSKPRGRIGFRSEGS